MHNSFRVRFNKKAKKPAEDNEGENSGAASGPGATSSEKPPAATAVDGGVTSEGHQKKQHHLHPPTPSKRHHHGKKSKHKDKAIKGGDEAIVEPPLADEAAVGHNDPSGLDLDLVHHLRRGSSEKVPHQSFAVNLPTVSPNNLPFIQSHSEQRASVLTPEEALLSNVRPKEWKPKLAKQYGYLSLFRYASWFDVFCMFVGYIASVLSGFCIPLMLYYFGELIRVKVLADKMANALYCIKNGGLKHCIRFWKKCNVNANESAYFEKEFMQRPNPNFGKITYDHMGDFIDKELLLTLAYTVLSSAYFLCWNYAGQNQAGKIRRAYILSLLEKDMTWFDLQKDPDLCNRFMENTRLIIDGIGESIPIATSITIMFFFCVAISFAHGWRLTLVALTSVPVMVVTYWIASTKKALHVLMERRVYRLAHCCAKEVLSKMRSVIIYGTQLKERALYKREINQGKAKVISAIFSQSVWASLVYILNLGVWAVIIWYGTALLLLGTHFDCSDKPKYDRYDAGDVVIIITSCMFACSNIYVVFNVIKAVEVAKLCGREVFKIIDGPNGIDNVSDEGFIPTTPLKGRVEFFSVRFSYPGKKDDPVLNNLTLTAEPHSTTAIVGISNSGKSTVLKMISKEYIPDSGYIKIDGMDIRTLNTKWLRSQIGFVPKDLTLFDMTIEDNVRMGKLDANFYEVQDACKKSGAHDFIISLKKGYQTKIGHKGKLLTPGQQQLISIARALIRDPICLLMDEPAEFLDSQSTAEFMQSLQKISQKRTVILVSHRLATVIHSNMIYCLKNGRTVEKGEHNKLIKTKGPYSQLCAATRASKSIRLPKTIDGFDTSELSIISCVRTFSSKPILPTLYNNLLNIDPVVTKMAYKILKNNRETSKGFHSQLEWTLYEGQELPVVAPDEDGAMRASQANRGGNEELQRGASAEDISNLNPTLSRIRTEMDKRTKIAQTIEEKGEYARMSVLNAANQSLIRILMVAQASPVLTTIGALSSLLLAFSVPLFCVFFGRLIEIYSDAWTMLKYKNWTVARRLVDDRYCMWTVGSFVIIGLFTGFFGFLQELCLNLSAFRTVQKLRRIIYAAMLQQDMSFFDDPENSPTRLASILFQDSDNFRNLVLGLYGTLFQNGFELIVIVSLCMYYALELTGYLLLIISLIVVISFLDTWVSKRQHVRMTFALQEMSDLILVVFQSKHVITVCQMEPHFIQEFTALQRKSIKSIKRLSFLRVFTYGLAQSGVYWGFGALMWLGAQKIHKGDLVFNDIITIGFLVIFALITIGGNLAIVTGFKYVGKGAKRMLDVIDRKPLLDSSEGFPILPNECTTSCEFLHTHFWRQPFPDVSLLKGVNLVIPPLKFTAIVGSPESGRSAYLEILCRYYNATGGSVLMDGKDITAFSAESIREYVSVVPKEPELFSRTVAQNIAIGGNSWNVTMDQIIEAAKEANVHNFIVSLPEGYETRIDGDHHDYLSSGQKHKIMIARALMKKPKILIIDDITSFLDQEGERTVLDSIERVKHDRTLIMISHSLFPVHKADMIAVMENGFLEEIGTHQELLKTRPDGIYALTWKSQNPMEDANFVKGKVNFHPKRSRSSKSTGQDKKAKDKGESTGPKETKETPVEPKISALSNASKEDDPGYCGSLLGYLGMGIVDNEEQHFENPYKPEK